VYLAQVDDPTGESSIALTAHLQRRLSQAGEVAPQVEVFAALEDLAPYQLTALGCAALLWTGQRQAPIRVAKLFDPVDAVGGPGFSEARPTIENPERADVLAYLDAGRPLLTTTALMDDVVNSRGSGVVPMTFRTDGEWVWSDATAYYLRHYGFAPDAQLLHSIRARRYVVPAVQPVALHRALATLQALTDDELGVTLRRRMTGGELPIVDPVGGSLLVRTGPRPGWRVDRDVEALRPRPGWTHVVCAPSVTARPDCSHASHA
jgi:hypothetical protein